MPSLISRSQEFARSSHRLAGAKLPSGGNGAWPPCGLRVKGEAERDLGHYVCRVDGAGFRAEMSILPSAASLWFGTALAQETLLDL
jgi:hypothetical protein